MSTFYQHITGHLGDESFQPTPALVLTTKPELREKKQGTKTVKGPQQKHYKTLQ